MPMKEPPVFGPNGAVLNSGIIPPEKIGQYDGSEPAQYSQPSPYTDRGKRYAWVANFLLHIILAIIAFAGDILSPQIVLGLVAFSIALSFVALKHIKDKAQYPSLRRQTFGDLILLIPLSYALLSMNIPVQVSVLGFLWASLILRLMLGIAAKLFPSLSSPR